MPTRLTSPCGRFTAWIEVSGAEGEVYQPVVVDGIAQGFVESVIGEVYTIHIQCPKGTDLVAYPRFSCKTTIDGQNPGSASTRRGDAIIRVNGWHVRQGTRAFQFSDIDLIEGDDDLARNVRESLGSILLKVRRTRKLPGGVETKEKRVIGAVSEKAKKGVIGAVTSQGAIIKKSQYCHHKTYPPDIASPLAIFTFLYRSKSLLQAQGVIPGTSPPTSNRRYQELTATDGMVDLGPSNFADPIVVESDSEDELEENEARELEEARAEKKKQEERIQRLETRQNKRKREKEVEYEDVKSGLRSLGKVKREDVGVGGGVGGVTGGVVDLTGED